ncbi:F-box protein: endocytic membrane traffic, recycling ReCYcling 1 [Coelomomyces lativittatus]|nr:F-box protein: endocytic membrane traffic, recycling ReCYcling 1 [Coelomomyces lativittatus]
MSSFTSSTSTLSPSSSPILKKKKNDLLSLPPPVLLRLLSFLPLPDLVRSVSLTCRRFKLLASHPQLFEQKLARLGHPKYTKLTLPSYLQASWLHLNFDSELPPKTLYKVIYERWFPFFRQFQDSNWKISPFWKSFKDKTMPAQYLPFFPAFQKTMNTENEHEILGNLKEGIQLFESELLQSFDQSHQVNNEQDMKMLAWALYFLNGGQSCLQLYMFKLPIFFDENKDVAGNFKALSMEGGDAQSPLAVYLEDLSFTMQEYLPKIASIFPDPMTFQYTFVQKVFDELISEYLQRLLKEAHQRDYSLFLQTLTVMFTHCSKWIVSLAHVLNTKKLEKLLDGSVHQFIEQYMDFERLHFTQECTSKLKQWSSTCTDQFLNLDVILECIAFNREAIKRCIVMMQRKGDMYVVCITREKRSRT